MLHLQRTLQCSVSVQLGVLTPPPSVPSVPDTDRSDVPAPEPVLLLDLGSIRTPHPSAGSKRVLWLVAAPSFRTARSPCANRLSCVLARPFCPYRTCLSALAVEHMTNICTSVPGGNSSPGRKSGDSLLARVETGETVVPLQTFDDTSIQLGPGTPTTPTTTPTTPTATATP
jgi:hypothetical protein